MGERKGEMHEEEMAGADEWKREKEKKIRRTGTRSIRARNECVRTIAEVTIECNSV